MSLCDLVGMLAIPRSNCHRIESTFAIRHEMAFINNEATAQNADAKIFSLGQRRMDVEIHLLWYRSFLPLLLWSRGRSNVSSLLPSNKSATFFSLSSSGGEGWGEEAIRRVCVGTQKVRYGFSRLSY